MLKTPPKTIIIGAGGFLGKAFLSRYRGILPDTLALAKNANTGGLIHYNLLEPGALPSEITTGTYTDALVLAGISRIKTCEDNMEMTGKVNVTGVLTLMRELVKRQIKPIFFTTDYVFDGTTGSYTETSAFNPLNEYGRQKAFVESYMKNTFDNYLIVRLGKVFSHEKGDGTLLDEMASVFSKGGTVRAASDQVFCPLPVTDLIEVVISLQIKNVAGTINVCSFKPCSRYELALTLAKEMGISSDKVEKITLAQLNESFIRPLNTSLLTDRLRGIFEGKLTPLQDSVKRVAGNWKDVC